MKKEYLGDGVYAEFDRDRITLTTEYGSPNDPSNIIHLELYLVDKLYEYKQRSMGEL